MDILPLGTVNALAKDLKIPLDINTAVRSLADGQERLIEPLVRVGEELRPQLHDDALHAGQVVLALLLLFAVAV